MCWLPGSVNLASPATNTGRLLSQSPELLMVPGTLLIVLRRQQSCRPDRQLGQTDVKERLIL